MMNALAVKLYLEIQDGIYKVGEKLPPIKELAAKFNVAEGEMRDAIGDMIYEGVLESVPFEKGETRVRKPCIIPLFEGNHSFTRETIRRGHKNRAQVITLETRKAWPQMQKRLQLTPEDDVLIMERVLYADEVPIGLEFSYMPARLYPGVTKETFEAMGDNQSTFKIMEDYGYKPYLATDEVAVASIQPREAEILKKDVGTPCLIRFRVATTREGLPIKGSRAIYLPNAAYQLLI